VTPEQAVILAAGNGQRLCSCGSPKPLVEVAGRALLDHVLALLAAAGVRRAVVVTGHDAERLRAHRFAEAPAVEFVHNPRHDEPNGLSLLCAEPRVRPPFLLLMADHLFAPELLQRLLQAGDPGLGGWLAVDRHVESVFDKDDATRVATAAGRVRAIGKGLEPFDAIDTGVFTLGAGAFDAMRASLAGGDASLSGAIRALCEQGRMGAVDVGDACWIDVDTPAALREAGRLAAAGRVGAGTLVGAGGP
jgi:choline kinase